MIFGQDPLANPQKKVYLRPSNNPLLRAPKNSTQFIIDDHENSHHFLSFEERREREEEEERQDRAMEERVKEQDRISPDDDHFWAEYSERDFESVYETAHQEEVYSWERAKIIEEITVLEMKQKQLINMLSQIDPVIYLQKLQQELSSLQVKHQLGSVAK